MKVTLVNFHYAEKEIRELRCQHRQLYGATYYPLTLLYLASYLKSRSRGNIRCRILDGNVHTFRFERILADGPDAVVVASSNGTLKRDLAYISRLKSLAPRLRVVLLGVSADVYRKEILGKYSVDFIARVPYERSISDFLLGKHTGHYSKKQREEELRNFSKQEVDYSLIDPLDYSFGGWPFRVPYGQVITGRGCRHECDFCVVPYIYPKLYVKRDTQIILGEIKYLIGRGVYLFNFFDEDFMNDKAFVAELMRAIIRGGLKIRFSCNARVDQLDLGLLRLMKKAGCAMVAVGVESFSPDVLARMAKGNGYDSLASIEKAAKIIPLTGHIVLGYEKSKKELEETINGIRKSRLAHISVYYATPLPGSSLHRKRKISFAESDKWDYDSGDFLYAKSAGSISLRMVKQRAIRGFYTLPRILGLVAIISKLSFFYISSLVCVLFRRRR